jgi:hypothetical protein
MIFLAKMEHPAAALRRIVERGSPLRF